MKDTTTRRAFIAAIAAAPAAALPALGAASTPISQPLAAAMAKHRAAQSAYEAGLADGWGDWRGDIPSSLMDPEWDAVKELVKTPCATDAEFVAKMRQLVARQIFISGPDWHDDYPWPILEAIELHLAGRA